MRNFNLHIGFSKDMPQVVVHGIEIQTKKKKILSYYCWVIYLGDHFSLWGSTSGRLSTDLYFNYLQMAVSDW